MYLHTIAVIGDMAMGGLLAFLCFYNPHKMQSFAKALTRWQIVIVYLLLIVYVYLVQDYIAHSLWVIFNRLILALFFAFIIFEQIYAPNSLYKIGRIKIFTQLGKYTYGLYCYHYLCLFAALKLGQLAGWNKTVWGVILLDNLTGLAISIVVAYLSYNYFELYFLRLKKLFDPESKKARISLELLNKTR